MKKKTRNDRDPMTRLLVEINEKPFSSSWKNPKYPGFFPREPGIGKNQTIQKSANYNISNALLFLTIDKKARNRRLRPIRRPHPSTGFCCV
jgi:hypothetical protein